MSGEQGFIDRHYFLLRRLHSLSGVIPIGVFLISHLITNSSVVWGTINTRAVQGDEFGAMGRGVATFQHEVGFINDLPVLIFIEVVGLWIPIAFHAIFGVFFAMSGSNNTARYGYADNRRYLWQRITGYLGLAFIVYHVATLRWGWYWLLPSGTAWSDYYAASTLAAALKGAGGEWSIAGVVVSLAYFIGVTALVYHFANGLVTAAMTWGLTITQKAQRRWAAICAGIGGVLMVAGWSALFGFLFFVNYDHARSIERVMVEEKYGTKFLQELDERYADRPQEQAAVIQRIARQPYPGPADLPDE